MAQLIVRNIPEAVMEDFRKLARRRGTSVEGEVRALITSAVDRDAQRRRFRLASKRQVASFQTDGRGFTESAELIREDRDR
jgi:plasmid stability protein